MIPPSFCLRRILVLLGVVAVTLCAAHRAARAQATRADSAAILYDAAQRLRVEGKQAAADALFDFILRRFGDTPVAVRVRAELSSRPAEPERSGRLELLAWGTIYGAWLGVAVPTAVQATGTTPYGIGLILGGPLGYLASKAYADAARPTLGQARAMTLGFRWGTWQVAGWYGALQSGRASTEGVVTAMVVGGVGGMAGAALYGRHRTVPVGVVTAASHGAYWGTWFGVMGLVLFDVKDNAALELVLAAGDAGLLTAAATAPRDITPGRVWLTTAAGLAGAAVGGGLDLIIQPNDAKLAVAIPTIASAIGLAVGVKLAKSAERSSMAPAPESSEATALLQMGEGGTRFGVPMPVPTFVPVGQRGVRRVYRPVLMVPLIAASF